VREIFHGELERLGTDLAAMCGMARAAMEHATKAMVEVDLSLAEQVITDDAGIQRVGEQCAEHACALLALQAPVARDLRTVVTAIQAAEKTRQLALATSQKEAAQAAETRLAIYRNHQPFRQ